MGRKKNLDDIKLMVSPLSDKIYLGQIDKTLGCGLVFSDNKKEITDEFFTAFIKFCLNNVSKDGRGVEWDLDVGKLTFIKKEKDNE